MLFRFGLRACTIALLGLALSTTFAVAQGNGHGHDKHDDDDRWHDHDYDHDRDHHDNGHHENGHHNGHGHYVDHDRDIWGWYRTHYTHLPPGLAKRDRLPPGLERRLIVNGTLPIEVRGRMQPCPHELEVMLPPPPPNYVHVVVGGNLVLYNRASFQIADVFHFEVN
jgi:Ni/Co efflux regulator RcnB